MSECWLCFMEPHGENKESDNKRHRSFNVLCPQICRIDSEIYQTAIFMETEDHTDNLYESTTGTLARHLYHVILSYFRFVRPYCALLWELCCWLYGWFRKSFQPRGPVHNRTARWRQREGKMSVHLLSTYLMGSFFGRRQRGIFAEC